MKIFHDGVKKNKGYQMNRSRSKGDYSLSCTFVRLPGSQSCRPAADNGLHWRPRSLVSISWWINARLTEFLAVLVLIFEAMASLTCSMTLHERMSDPKTGIRWFLPDVMLRRSQQFGGVDELWICRAGQM